MYNLTNENYDCSLVPLPMKIFLSFSPNRSRDDFCSSSRPAAA